MKAIITQIQAGRKGIFEISDENGLLFRAERICSKNPFSGKWDMKFNMSYPNGFVRYEAAYTGPRIRNPFKQQNKWEYSVEGRYGAEAVFYLNSDEESCVRYCIEKDSRLISCYNVAKGKIRVVSFYDNGKQIAQLTQPLNVENNRYTYYLHLTDANKDLLEIICFFTIYFNGMTYEDEFEYGGMSVNSAYTTSKEKKYYNPKWIEEKFGAQEAELFKSEVDEYNMAIKKKADKLTIIILLCILGELIVVGSILFISGILF